MTDTRSIEVAARDLPLSCPPAGSAVWNQHPLAFLDLARTGEATCPYCRAYYVLKGEAPREH